MRHFLAALLEIATLLLAGVIVGYVTNISAFLGVILMLVALSIHFYVRAWPGILEQEDMADKLKVYNDEIRLGQQILMILYLIASYVAVVFGVIVGQNL